MVKHSTLVFWLFLGGVCAHLSCNSLDFLKAPSNGQTAPTPAVVNQLADTVTIELFTIRLAPHQNELLQQLWQEVDEQSLPPQLRRELHAEGFRVGTLGNLVSPTLAQLLKNSSNGSHSGEPQKISAADVAREATVTCVVRNLLPEMRARVKMFDDQNTIPELSLFRLENGMLEGQTYTRAEGVLYIGASANRDGSADIQISPELEHGSLERRIRIVSAMIVHEEGKQRRPFETLAISHRLQPGQWIILGTTMPDSSGAGQAFFVRKNPALEQRLLAIRLVRVTPATLTTNH